MGFILSKTKLKAKEELVSGIEENHCLYNVDIIWFYEKAIILKNKLIILDLWNQFGI